MMEEALQSLSHAATILPSWEIIHNLAELQFLSGDPQSSLSSLEKINSLQPPCRRSDFLLMCLKYKSKILRGRNWIADFRGYDDLRNDIQAAILDDSLSKLPYKDVILLEELMALNLKPVPKRFQSYTVPYSSYQSLSHHYIETPLQLTIGFLSIDWGVHPVVRR